MLAQEVQIGQIENDLRRRRRADKRNDLFCNLIAAREDDIVFRGMRTYVVCKVGNIGSVETFHAYALQCERVPVEPCQIAGQEGDFCSETLQHADFLKCRVTSGITIDLWKLMVKKQDAESCAAILLSVGV